MEMIADFMRRKEDAKFEEAFAKAGDMKRKVPLDTELLDFLDSLPNFKIEKETENGQALTLISASEIGWVCVDGSVRNFLKTATSHFLKVRRRTSPENPPIIETLEKHRLRQAAAYGEREKRSQHG